MRIGWVGRPWSASQWSLYRASSATPCLANSSGVARCFVASAATALAQFSQNSKVDVWSRSGQAQPGQSKPSGWLVDSLVFAPCTGTSCSISCLARSEEHTSELQSLMRTSYAVFFLPHTQTNDHFNTIIQT